MLSCICVPSREASCTGACTEAAPWWPGPGCWVTVLEVMASLHKEPRVRLSYSFDVDREGGGGCLSCESGYILQVSIRHLVLDSISFDLCRPFFYLLLNYPSGHKNTLWCFIYTGFNLNPDLLSLQSSASPASITQLIYSEER